MFIRQVFINGRAMLVKKQAPMSGGGLSKVAWASALKSEAV
jgi:hypothetical protein